MVWGGKDVEAKADIVYVIHPNGEVYSTPKKGQKIQWVIANPLDQTQGIQVPVTFLNGSPCKDGAITTPNCEIDKDAIGGYPYSCPGGPGNPPCKDPGIDPNSSLGPTLVQYPAAAPRRAVVDQSPDLNFSFRCEAGKILGVNLADTAHPFGPGETYTPPNSVKIISFEANRFIPAITMNVTNQGDPALCNIPSGGYSATCTAGPGTSGKVYQMEVKDSSANGACKNSGSVKATITVQ
jgi:hypothetical protein